ncbi:MAG: hypothetical protein AB200_00235 [Parcubacteria bacterium C7867-005]|nr:MAG: hypothetical protein AB200_00235 [Parcubacteria bacterium C7867-005]
MKKLILLAVAFVPSFAFAQSLGNVETFIRSIGRLVNLALPIVVALALLGFFYGLMKFIFAADDEDARKSAKDIMIYGVIALFVMVSVWGLVGFVGNALGIQQGQNSGNIPRVQGL